MYWSIPDLMEIARRMDDAGAIELDSDEFKREAAKFVGRIYYESGERLLRDEDAKTAVERLSKSIELYPTQAAYQARAQAHDKLGNQQQSKEDLEKADGLAE
jgi:tetratricopeptide (TPR) repeat protein